MRCVVLLFAQLAEAVGTGRLEIELGDGATVADALDALAGDHPAVGEMRETLAVALNERYCRTDAPVHDGDVLALIPPVSGG